MKLRLLIVVFLIAATKLSLHAQNFTPAAPIASSNVSPSNIISGYFFQAQTNFIICGLKVRFDNAATAPPNQRIFVVKFSRASFVCYKA